MKMETKEFEKGKAFDFVKSVEYSEGAIVSKNVLKNDAGNVSLFAFDKGEGLSEHTAPFNAMVQVIDGNADVIIDGKHNPLKAGESIIMPANIPHALMASEKFKMILTMIKG
jgi:quercetin dioxygenase-like cupin family protein